MKKRADAGYNQRLFSKGIRRKLHVARFEWLASSISRLHCEPKSIIEIGCFDGKTIDYLPTTPAHYLGLDANWEGGLDIAKKKWTNQPNYKFKQCNTPKEMKVKGESFDISICMETLEHLSPQMADLYLGELAKITKKYIFITVPNEIGIVFFVKYILKRLFGDVDPYTLNEFINETLGNTDKVKRCGHSHKGFNYNNLITNISDYYEIIEVSENPVRLAPLCFNFGIGIIGKSKYSTKL